MSNLTTFKLVTKADAAASPSRRYTQFLGNISGTMNKIDDSDGLARLRIGCVLDKGAVRQEAGAASIGVDLEGLCITAWAPTALLAALGAPGAPAQQRLDVLNPPDGAERLALLVMQFNTTQLRVVMPLSEPAVRHYLLDCAQRGRIRLLLADEATKARTLMDFPGGFRDPELTRRLVHEAEGLTGDPGVLLKFGQLICPLNGVRTLIPGTAVKDAVTVLISNHEFELLSRTGAGLLSRRRSSLH
jgi:hypothetical protein